MKKPEHDTHSNMTYTKLIKTWLTSLKIKQFGKKLPFSPCLTRVSALNVSWISNIYSRRTEKIWFLKLPTHGHKPTLSPTSSSLALRLSHFHTHSSDPRWKSPSYLLSRKQEQHFMYINEDALNIFHCDWAKQCLKPRSYWGGEKESNIETNTTVWTHQGQSTDFHLLLRSICNGESTSQVSSGSTAHS